MNQTVYPGIDQDTYGGMTYYGRIIKDAWVFGLIPETETCAGWSHGQLDTLTQQVNAKWEEHGLLPSRLPAELRERYARIHEAAVQRAREQGWNPELGDDD